MIQEKEKLTGEALENRIQDEANQLAFKILFFECSNLLKALLRDAEANWRDAAVDLDSVYSCGACCPHCGGLHYSGYDGDDPEDAGDGCYICKDCGQRFDDPDYIEPCQYWFIDARWVDDFEAYGEKIIKTDDAYIWARMGCNYGWESEGVFRYLAEKKLRDCGIID